MMRWWGVLLVVCAFGCDDAMDADAGTDGFVEPSGPVAVFDVPETGAVGFTDAPYPNEVFRGADGTLDLGSVPGRVPIWNAVRETVNERMGFCRTCPIHFPIEGSLDPASVPEDAVGAGAADDPIVLIRADGVGGFIPLMADALPSSVRILPSGQRVLAPNITYVAALTDALTGPGGRPLGARDSFLAIRDGSDTTSREAASVGAALDALAAAGVARDRVVSVAWFTTVDTGEILRNLASIVDSAPTPTTTVDRVYRRSDGTLDELLGDPSMAGAGFVPATTAGETAVNHENVEMLVLGTFEVPRLVTGSGTDIGFLQRSADGSIEPISTDVVPFVLSVPVGADPTSLPVALTGTSQPGTRDFGVMMANTLNGIGIATISIDPFQNGARAESATDDANSFRGTMGADGFSEFDPVAVASSVQGASRNGDEVLLHPRFLEAVLAQWMSDLAMTLRLLQEGDVSSIASADPALAGLAFDASRVFYVGYSNGTYTGVSAVALRSGVAAAVFNAGGFSTLRTSCHSPTLRPTIDLILSGPYAVREAFDGEDVRLCLNPAVALPFAIYDELAPGTTLHYLLDEPLTDATPPHVLFQQAEHDEAVGQASGEGLVVTAGVPSGGAGGYVFTEITTEAGPFADNRVTPNGTVTAGAWMFADALHNMILYRSEELDFEPRFRFPFTARTPPTPVDNPTDDVHAQIAAFFQTVLDGGPVTIAAP